MRNFADLADPLPICLPTLKCLVLKDLPTLPTFNVRARIRVKKQLSICAVIDEEKSLHARVKVGKVGKVGKSIKNKEL